MPHRYCDNHFLRDVAKPVLEADSHAKVQIRRKVRNLRKEAMYSSRTGPSPSIPTNKYVLQCDACSTRQRLGTVFAMVRELRRDDVKLPTRDANGLLSWRVATLLIVQTALHHPLYAGAYSWGRRQTHTHVDLVGRISRHRAQAEWSVLLHDRAGLQLRGRITWPTSDISSKIRGNRKPKARRAAGWCSSPA